MRISLRVVLAAAVTAALGTGATLWATAAGAAHTAGGPHHHPAVRHGAGLPRPAGGLHDPVRGGDVGQLSRPLQLRPHEPARPAAIVIPALATALPKVTDAGKTYTMTLRPNLVYSNGKPVKASDFAYSIERALKLNWGGDPFYTGTSSVRRPTRRAPRRRSPASSRTTRPRTIVVHLLGRVRAVPEHPRVPLVGLRARGHADEDGDDDDARGRRAVHDHQRQPGQVLARPDQPVLRQGGDPGDPGRQGQRAGTASRRTRRPRPRTCSTTRPTSSTPATRSRPRCSRRSRRRHPTAMRRPPSCRRSTSS